MKTLVVYYSNTGSNKYLAVKIARSLKCEIEALRPRLNFFPFLILFSLINKSLGIKTLSSKVHDYDRIIVCGPIWMGQFISPLHDFVHKYRKSIKTLCFATCCASSDAAKDAKFGYNLAFKKVKNLLGEKCIHVEAFPIGLVLPEDKKEDSNATMKTRLSDNNFSGEIQNRFENFIKTVTE